MGDDKENLNEVAPLLDAISKAIAKNGDNRNIDSFLEHILENLSDADQVLNFSKEVKPNHSTSNLALTELPYAAFKNLSKLTDAQIRHLQKIKFLKISNNCIYRGEIHVIPKKTALTVTAMLSALTFAFALNIVIQPFPGVWLWPLAFGVGSMIGLLLGKTFDKSFKVYEILPKFYHLIDFIPAQVSH